MPQLRKVIDGQTSGVIVVEHHRRWTVPYVVTGYRNHRQADVRSGGIDEQDALNTTLCQHSPILFQKFWVRKVGNREVEIAMLNKTCVHAHHERGEVTIAEVDRHDAYRHRSLVS